MMRRAYGLMLRLYPKGFREMWAAELGMVVAEAERRASVGGWRELARARAWLLLDVMRSLPGAWKDARQQGGAGAPERALQPAPGGEGGGPRRRGRWLDLLWLDVRFTLGLWRRSPSFTAFAIATLALGMASVVAIFSVLNGVLLRPMPYEGADRVVMVSSGQNFGQTVSYADVEDMRQSPWFEAVALWIPWRAGFQEADGTVGVRHSASVDPSFFETLGVKPLMGRVFTAADADGGAEGNVVISWSTWQVDLGGRPDVIGAEVTIDGRAWLVQGVLPREFIDPLGYPVNAIETSVFRVRQPPAAEVISERARRPIFAVARLREGTDPDAAAKGLTERVAPSYAALQRAPEFQLQPVEQMHTSAVRPTLILLSVAVGLLMLIGCANAANLLLSRATVRRRELTVRGALGASRGRLVAQLLTESVMLALVAGAIGLVAGYYGAHVVVAFGGESLPRANSVAIDGTVVGFAFLASLLTAMLFGLAPATQWSRVSFSAGLGGARGTGAAASGKRVRSVLVVAETALAVMLTFGAGLLATSLWKLQNVDPGYDPDHVLTLRATMTPARYPLERRLQMHEQIVQSIERIPGVAATAAVTYHPLSGGSVRLRMTTAGEPTRESPTADFRSITPDFFRAMGMELRAGSGLSWSNRAGTEPVAVVNEAFAATMLKDIDPLGATINVPGQSYRVIGVVGNVKEFDLSEPAIPIMYATYEQTPPNLVPSTSTIVVRGVNDPRLVTREIRAAIRDIDATVPVAFIRTMRDMMDINLLAPRMRTILIGTFGVLAAVLAAVGLAGVMAYTVSQSVPEIGVRMALGARAGEVAGRVLRNSIGLTMAGLVLGLAGALAASHVIANMLFGVPANDPRVAIAVAGATLLFAGLASWYPAWRAARVDPAKVLRTS